MPIHPTGPTEPSADDIRRQLAELRSALRRDARDLATDARTLVDWRHHFRRHPRLCCTVAVAVGYVLVPRRAGASKRHFARPAESAAGTQPAAPAAAEGPMTAGVPQSLLSTALTMAATAIVRRSIAHLIELGREQFEKNGQSRGASHPSGSPNETMP